MSNWYSIKASLQPDKPTEVMIYDEIGGWGITAAQFVRDIKAIGDGPINVRINSPGGSVFDGLAIYHYLSNRKDVTVTIDGIAASIASIIAMAGSKRVMPESAYIMIHNPWTGAVGDANDLRDQADLLDKLGETLAGIYAKCTKKTKETIRAMMDAETWIDGATALADGFVTEISSCQPIKANIRSDRFARTPESVIQNAAPSELEVDDDVAWVEGASVSYGEIVEISRSGTLTVPDAGIAIAATPEDPAALVKKYQQVAGTDAFIEGEMLVGLNFSQLTKVEDLKVIEVEDKVDVGSIVNKPSPTAPDAAKRAFRKGIQQVEDGKAGDGLEPATVKEARALAAGETPTEAKIRKANAWWGRNERFLEAEADSPADVSANLWGGAAGRDWFRAKYNELEQQQEQSNLTNDTMEKLLNALAENGLLASAQIDEDAAVSQFTSAFAEVVKNHTEALAAITSERDGLKAKLDEIAKAEVSNKVENAIKDGRIKSELKDQWVAQISADPSALELLDSISAPVLGAEPVGAPTAKTSVDLRAEFDAITDPKKRSAFWSVHKAQLLKK